MGHTDGIGTNHKYSQIKLQQQEEQGQQTNRMSRIAKKRRVREKARTRTPVAVAVATKATAIAAAMLFDIHSQTTTFNK